MAGEGTSPSRPATVALRAGREAARVHGLAEEVGGGEDLRVAQPRSAAGERLRAAAGEWGGDDTVGHEPDYAAQACPSSMLMSRCEEARNEIRNRFAKQSLRACLVRVRVKPFGGF